MLLSFQGMLLSEERGVNAAEFGGKQFTALEFAPVGLPVMKLRADGHVDMTSYLRKEADWSLEVAPKTTGGKLAFKVTKITGKLVK